MASIYEMRDKHKKDKFDLLDILGLVKQGVDVYGMLQGLKGQEEQQGLLGRQLDIREDENAATAASAVADRREGYYGDLMDLFDDGFALQKPPTSMRPVPPPEGANEFERAAPWGIRKTEPYSYDSPEFSTQRLVDMRRSGELTRPEPELRDFGRGIVGIGDKTYNVGEPIGDPVRRDLGDGVQVVTRPGSSAMSVDWPPDTGAGGIGGTAKTVTPNQFFDARKKGHLRLATDEEVAAGAELIQSPNVNGQLYVQITDPSEQELTQELIAVGTAAIEAEGGTQLGTGIPPEKQTLAAVEAGMYEVLGRQGVNPVIVDALLKAADYEQYEAVVKDSVYSQSLNSAALKYIILAADQLFDPRSKMRLSWDQ